MESSSRRTNQRRRWIQRGCTSLVLSMAVTLLLLDLTHAFGILHLTTSNSGRYPMRLFMSETIETVGGQNMCAIVDDFVDAQMKWMAAAGTNEDGDDPNLNESDNSFVSWEHLILSEDVSPMSPPLTYQKFVTMQASRLFFFFYFGMLLQTLCPLPRPVPPPAHPPTSPPGYLQHPFPHRCFLVARSNTYYQTLLTCLFVHFWGIWVAFPCICIHAYKHTESTSSGNDSIFGRFRDETILFDSGEEIKRNSSRYYFG